MMFQKYFIKLDLEIAQAFFTDFCPTPTNGFAGSLSLGGKLLSLEKILSLDPLEFSENQ